MNFEYFLPALRAGKKVRRQSWEDDGYICRDGLNMADQRGDILALTGLFASDWEVIEDRPKRGHISSWDDPALLDIIDEPKKIGLMTKPNEDTREIAPEYSETVDKINEIIDWINKQEPKNDRKV